MVCAWAGLGITIVAHATVAAKQVESEPVETVGTFLYCGVLIQSSPYFIRVRYTTDTYPTATVAIITLFNLFSYTFFKNK